jgi:hypothetical protein
MSTQKPVSIANLAAQLKLAPAAAIGGSAVEHPFPLSAYSSPSQ